MMTDSSRSPLADWLNSMPDHALDFYREALAALRQMHGDVWNGIRFFLTVNTVLFGGMTAIAKFGGRQLITAALLLALAVVGLAVTVVARRILTKHREFYVKMLLRKTLIEDALGSYAMKLSGVDMSFPWHVDEKHVEALKADPSKWLEEQKQRRTTVTALLFRVYEAVIAIHIVVAAIAVLWIVTHFISCRSAA